MKRLALALALAACAVAAGAAVAPATGHCAFCWSTKCYGNLGCGPSCFCARSGTSGEGICLTRPD